MSFDEENVTPAAQYPQKDWAVPIYKKWFKSSAASGFISITPWDEGNKFTIDIGATEGESVKSSTKCFVDPVDLGLYLQTIVAGEPGTLYPKRSGCPSPESFLAFGGSGELSRVFKIHYWGAKEGNDGNRSGFAWKCGHFKGKVTDSGAIMPLYDQKISADMIRISLLEMHEIEYRVRMYIMSKFTDPKWHGVKS